MHALLLPPAEEAADILQLLLLLHPGSAAINHHVSQMEETEILEKKGLATHTIKNRPQESS